jgi:hypothetical protein
MLGMSSLRENSVKVTARGRMTWVSLATGDAKLTAYRLVLLSGNAGFIQNAWPSACWAYIDYFFNLSVLVLRTLTIQSI